VHLAELTWRSQIYTLESGARRSIQTFNRFVNRIVSWSARCACAGQLSNSWAWLTRVPIKATTGKTIWRCLQL